ncbi:PadR family transcriptional regulator [Streptomyces sioyaensis]|uniref:PadR family transcriptional regulator n=1 Tax=Streptomyces sioyaensis TaxID=67364 RepID=UPI0037B0084F
MADAATSWLRGALELAVAAALAESDRHGYALAQRIEQCGLGGLRGGALYPVLGRMEGAGLVESHWQAGEGGPGRKVYRLTDSGRARLREDTVRWNEFTAAMGRLLDQPGKGQE